MYVHISNQRNLFSQISFELQDGKVHNVAFVGGCNGNLKGISKLVEGRDAKEIIALLKGNLCGNKPTSCRISWRWLWKQH